jgi:hypothetical protein
VLNYGTECCSGISVPYGPKVGSGHLPDAEVWWPEAPGSGYGGECWAIEAELTPKPLARTIAIMSELLARTADYQPTAAPGPGPRYHRVIYLAAPAATKSTTSRRTRASQATSYYHDHVRMRSCRGSAVSSAPKPRLVHDRGGFLRNSSQNSPRSWTVADGARCCGRWWWRRWAAGGGPFAQVGGGALDCLTSACYDG